MKADSSRGRVETRGTLLVVLQQFPTLSETFLYTMIENLESAGFNIKVTARYHGQAPHAPAFADRVRFLPPEKRNVFVKAVLALFWTVRYAVRHPDQAMRLVGFLRQREPLLKNCLNLTYRILPLLLYEAEVTYFSFGGMAAKYLEYIHFNRNPSFFSLRGSEINIEPLLHENYRSRLKDALRTAKGVHCVCVDIERKAQALTGGELARTQVIYTAVNPVFLREESENILSETDPEVGLRIISTGRLDWRKGFEHGMMAIRELIQRDVKVRWEIYGSGAYEVCLQWAIRDLGLEKHVFIHQGVDQRTLRDRLKASDLYFHPAVHEGISNSALEAMAVGLPVVACDVGGMQEAITNGVNGILTPARDWRAMAGALAELSANPQRRGELGREGEKTCRERFTPAQQQAAFLDFFDVTAQ